MEQVSIQATELKKLKEQVSSLETNCKHAQFQNKEETQKNLRMVERIKALEKDLTLQEPLGDLKDILCANTIDSINDVWPSIHIIFEQTEFVKTAIEAIQKKVEELGNKPEEENQLITFLKNKNRHQLDELEIEDRTTAILEIKKARCK